MNGIPDHLASVVAAVEAVCSDLDATSAFRPFGPQRWIRDVTALWGDGIQHVALLLDADAPLLAVYVTLELPEPSRHVDSLAKAAARANYGLLPGCFEIDVETGETRYRSALYQFSETLGTREVAQLVSEALMMTKTYAPAFQKIVTSNADPVEAVAEIESA